MSIKEYIDGTIKGLVERDPFVFRQVVAVFLDMKLYSLSDKPNDPEYINLLTECFLKLNGINTSGLPEINITKEQCESKMKEFIENAEKLINKDKK